MGKNLAEEEKNTRQIQLMRSKNDGLTKDGRTDMRKRGMSVANDIPALVHPPDIVTDENAKKIDASVHHLASDHRL